MCPRGVYNRIYPNRRCLIVTGCTRVTQIFFEICSLYKQSLFLEVTIENDNAPNANYLATNDTCDNDIERPNEILSSKRRRNSYHGDLNIDTSQKHRRISYHGDYQRTVETATKQGNASHYDHEALKSFNDLRSFYEPPDIDFIAIDEDENDINDEIAEIRSQFSLPDDERRILTKSLETHTVPSYTCIIKIMYFIEWHIFYVICISDVIQ